MSMVAFVLVNLLLPILILNKVYLDGEAIEVVQKFCYLALEIPLKHKEELLLV